MNGKKGMSEAQLLLSKEERESLLSLSLTLHPPFQDAAPVCVRESVCDAVCDFSPENHTPKRGETCTSGRQPGCHEWNREVGAREGSLVGNKGRQSVMKSKGRVRVHRKRV